MEKWGSEWIKGCPTPTRVVRPGVFLVFEDPKFQAKIWQASLKVSNCPLHKPAVSRDSVSFLTKVVFRRWLLRDWKRT